MWSLYDRLITQADAEDSLAEVRITPHWTIVFTRAGRMGVAATQPTQRDFPVRGEIYEGLCLDRAAQLVKSWDLREAAIGAAVINACVNQPERFHTAGEPDAFLRYRTRYEGRKVAVVGRFAYLEERLRGLCDLYVLERRPGESDLPDTACEYLLPEMDTVVITGSALANKTLPRLLELSRRAFTVVSGPSTPMHPALFDLGADALCGLCLTQPERLHALGMGCGAIFDCGRMDVLEREVSP